MLDVIYNRYRSWDEEEISAEELQEIADKAVNKINANFGQTIAKSTEAQKDMSRTATIPLSEYEYMKQKTQLAESIIKEYKDMHRYIAGLYELYEHYGRQGMAMCGAKLFSYDELENIRKRYYDPVKKLGNYYEGIQ